MSEKLEIIITATDKASSVFSSIGKAAGGVLKVGLAAAAAGVGVLATGLGFAVSEAMAAQKTQAQLAAVLKSTGGAAGVTADMANDLATELSKMTTFEDDAIVAGESMLLTFTNIGADVFPAATEAILDLSTATGQDLQSSAVQLGKALNDPIAGITSLTRVGVTFTEEQKNMIAAMVEAGDVEGAQVLILQELQKEFGGSAEAAGATFSGQLTILKNSLGNVAEEVGTALMPALQGFVTDAVLPFVQEYGPKLAQWFAEFLPKAIQTASDFWNNVLYPALVIIYSFIRDYVIPIVSDIVDWLKIYLPPALQTAADFWNNTLHPALDTVYKFIRDSVIPIVSDIVDWLQTNLPIAIEVAKDFWDNYLYPAIYNIWQFVYNTLLPVLADIIVWLATTIASAVTTFKGIWDKVHKAFTDTYDFINDKVLPRLREIVDFLVNGWGNVVGKVQEVWGGIKTAVQPLVDIFNTIKNAIQWIIDHIGSAISGASNFANSTLSSVLAAIEEIEAGHGGRPGAPGGPRKGLPPNIPDLNYDYGTGGTVINNWNLTINADGVADPIQSFELMKALAGAS